MKNRPVLWVSFALLFLLVMPFLVPFSMAAVIAAVMRPAVGFFERHRIPRFVGILISTLAVSAFFLIPITFLVITLVNLSIDTLAQFKSDPMILQNVYTNIVNHSATKWLLKYLPMDSDSLKTNFLDVAGSALVVVGNGLKDFASKMPAFFLDVLFVILGIFVLLLESHHIVDRLKPFSPLRPNLTDELIKKLSDLCRSVVLASVVSGLAQSIIFSIALLIAGIGNVVLFSQLIFVASFIPLIGSAPVTFGLATYALIFVSNGAGIGLLIAAALVAGVDNLIRPMVLKGGSNLHPLIGFVSALGGLNLLGVTGIFLGPIMAGGAIALIELVTRSDSTETGALPRGFEI